MGAVISIINQKGGVAKTTTVHNVAASLAGKGKKVLMIDFDAQASLTIAAGLEPRQYPNNIIAVLRDMAPITECVAPVKENLDIITSGQLLSTVNNELQALMTKRDSRLKAKLYGSKKEPGVADNYDYILIDCSPTFNVLSLNAIVASDYVLIPVKTDYLSYRGLTQVVDNILAVQEDLKPELQILGIVATLHEPRVKDDQDIIELLRTNEHGIEVLGVVKKMMDARRGVYDGLSTVELKPYSDVGRAYDKITDKVIEKVGI